MIEGRGLIGVRTLPDAAGSGRAGHCAPTQSVHRPAPVAARRHAAHGAEVGYAAFTASDDDCVYTDGVGALSRVRVFTVGRTRSGGCNVSSLIALSPLPDVPGMPGEGVRECYPSRRRLHAGLPFRFRADSTYRNHTIPTRATRIPHVIGSCDIVLPAVFRGD